MSSKDLQARSVEELSADLKTVTADLFQARISNFTHQLSDTSAIRKKRRDIARIKTELRRRELESLKQAVQQSVAAQAVAADAVRT